MQNFLVFRVHRLPLTVVTETLRHSLNLTQMLGSDICFLNSSVFEIIA